MAHNLGISNKSKIMFYLLSITSLAFFFYSTIHSNSFLPVNVNNSINSKFTFYTDINIDNWKYKKKQFLIEIIKNQNTFENLTQCFNNEDLINSIIIKQPMNPPTLQNHYTVQDNQIYVNLREWKDGYNSNYMSNDPISELTDFSDISKDLNNIAKGDFEQYLGLNSKFQDSREFQRYDRAQLSNSIFLLEKPFNFSGSDILIYLHMQKTGGTAFGNHLVDHLGKCQRIRGVKRRECQRSLSKKKFKKVVPFGTTKSSDNDLWIFSRFSIGWICGLHADYTELKNCLNPAFERLIGKEKTKKLNKYWITNLRSPLERYISEWQHIFRSSSTWEKNSKFNCGNVEFSKNCFQNKCFKDSWANVSLNEFNNCAYNLASNRQTRMLADLELEDIGCYKSIFPINLMSSKYHEAMQNTLNSAKYNLENKISYFMLLKHQRLSQYLFEKIFGVKFTKNLLPKENTVASGFNHKQNKSDKLTEKEISEITNLNLYDIELYNFAEKLFFKRLQIIINRDKEMINKENLQT